MRILAFITTLVFVLGGCAHFRKEPLPREQETKLCRVFRENRAAFDDIRQALQNSDIKTVWRDEGESRFRHGNNPLPKRLEEQVNKLLDRLILWGCTVDSGRIHLVSRLWGVDRLYFVRYGFAWGERETDWSDGVVVPRLDEIEAMDLEKISYLRLDEHWYLFRKVTRVEDAIY